MSDLKVDLSGKTALVTGATSGFGTRFAEVLVAAGAKVAITGRRENLLNDLAGRLGRDNCLPLTVDATDESAIKPCFDKIEQAFGPVDILVNNAGVSSYKPLLEWDGAEFDFVMDVNAKAAFLYAVEAANRMIPGKIEGRIINISSIGSERALKGNTVYCMSKAAISMMTENMALEWARYGINVTAIGPGYIKTELNDKWFDAEGGAKQVSRFPRRRLGEVEDLDGILLFLCSDSARIVTGETILVDDGQALVGP